MLPYSIRTSLISTSPSRRRSTARHRTSWYSKCSSMSPLARRTRSLISVPVWDRWYYKWPDRFPLKRALVSRRRIRPLAMPNAWIKYFASIWAGLANATASTNWSRVIFWSTSIARRSPPPHWCLSITLPSVRPWIISWRSDLLICEMALELFHPNRSAHSTFGSQIGKPSYSNVEIFQFNWKRFHLVYTETSPILAPLCMWAKYRHWRAQSRGPASRFHIICMWSIAPFWSAIFSVWKPRAVITSMWVSSWKLSWELNGEAVDTVHTYIHTFTQSQISLKSQSWSNQSVSQSVINQKIIIISHLYLKLNRSIIDIYLRTCSDRAKNV